MARPVLHSACHHWCQLGTHNWLCTCSAGMTPTLPPLGAPKQLCLFLCVPPLCRVPLKGDQTGLYQAHSQNPRAAARKLARCSAVPSLSLLPFWSGSGTGSTLRHPQGSMRTNSCSTGSCTERMPDREAGPCPTGCLERSSWKGLQRPSGPRSSQNRRRYRAPGGGVGP